MNTLPFDELNSCPGEKNLLITFQLLISYCFSPLIQRTNPSQYNQWLTSYCTIKQKLKDST